MGALRSIQRQQQQDAEHEKSRAAGAFRAQVARAMREKAGRMPRKGELDKVARGVLDAQERARERALVEQEASK